jgi:hypothetical protein
MQRTRPGPGRHRTRGLRQRPDETQQHALGLLFCEASLVQTPQSVRYCNKELGKQTVARAEEAAAALQGMGAKRQRTSGANVVPSPAPHVGPPPPPAPGTCGYNMHCPPVPVSLMTLSALDASLDRTEQARGNEETQCILLLHATWLNLQHSGNSSCGCGGSLLHTSRLNIIAVGRCLTVRVERI